MCLDDKQLQQISQFISRGLKLCGKSACMSRIFKTRSVILDTIWTLRGKSKLKLFHGGSAAEGTTTASSDVDQMAVVCGIEVVMTEKLDKTKEDQDYSNLFFVDSAKSNPGYVRLKALKSYAAKHEAFGDFSFVLDEDTDGSYLSSDKFVEFLLSEKSPCESQFRYRHGPCLTFEHQSIFGYYSNDVAYALVCDQWPEEVNEWITRPRHHNWPDPELVTKISHQECHAVAVGDPTSSVCSQEWRISFLLGEREIVWSFNDSQIQTYIILKLLRKKYLEPLAPDQVRSYHLKTIMFWLIEEEGNSRWFEENLLKCVSHCLARLQHCIEERIIEHYFYRKRNLLRYKLGSETERKLVLNEIASIRKNIATHTLNDGLVNTSKVWCACQGDIQLFIQLCSKDTVLTTYFTIAQKVTDTKMLHQSHFSMYVNTSVCYDSVEILLQIRKVLEQDLKETDSKTFKIMTQFLDILTGLGYYRLSLQEDNDTTMTNLQEKCRELFTAASSLDDLSGILYLATFYFCTNQQILCHDVVKSVFPKTGIYLYTGRCSTNYGIEYENGKIILHPQIPVTGEEDETFHPVFDVVFTKADINFVPYPIKFECALMPDYGYDFIVYHPCVYAQALMYLNLGAAKDEDASKEALENLVHLVGNLGNTPPRFRALNLLGYCHSMKGDFGNAVACYTASLQETFSMALVTNAAAYHLAILAFGIIVKAE